ncbi:MAG: S-layer homology domain-containing protein [Clostridia bacterium]|nr:S-layer homology domain-containing protein [Clostridia bacterium]
MKAFKKFSAIVIALAMVMSCAVCNVAFAADNFNDVNADNIYYKAIGDLVDKGIINGYDNGDGTFSFKPDGNITRAEFCAIIARADAPDGYVFTSATSSFTDVATTDWSCGYIEYAVRRGIVNGMGDGRFAPNDPVTYAQAIKMIVCTLNYGFAAESTTPWYQTYINIAGQLNLTKNAMGSPDAPAIRGLVAQLVYNMNNTAPAVQTGTDKNGNPIYEAGKGTFEEDSKGTKTVEGQLLGVFDKTITGQSEGLNKREALVQVKNDEEVFLIGSYSVEEIAELLGYEVKISYSEDNSGDYTIERITKTDSNEVYEISDIDISDITADYLEYYDEDSRTGLEEIKFSSDMVVMVNGGYVDGDIEEAMDIDCGSITFIDYDGNGRMDVAFVKSYETMFVGRVTNNDGVYKVYDKFDPSRKFELDDNNDEITVKVAANGSNSLTKGTLSNITQSSVVSLAVSVEDPSVKEIIVSKKTASGSSSSVEVKSISNDYTKIKLGNNTFEPSNYYLGNLDSEAYPQELSVGDTCAVYLDFTGKIAAVDKKETSSSYGYITLVGGATSGGFEEDQTIYVRMYDANGKLYSKLEVDEKIKINGTRSEPADLIDVIEDSADYVNQDKDETKIVNAENAVLVKYEISSNKLKSVYTVDESDDDAIQPEFISEGTQALTYKSSSNSFTLGGEKQFTISSSTKVFVVPLNRDQTDYRVSTGTGYFTNGNTYMIDAFDVSGNSVKAVVVYGVTKVIKANAETFIVDEVFDTEDKSGEPIQGMTYYKLGNTEVEDEPLYSMESDTFDGIAAGDVVRVLMNGSVVDEVHHVYSVEDGLITGSSDILGGEENYGYNEETGIFEQSTGSQTYEAMYGTVTMRPGEGYGDDKIYVSVDGDPENEQAFKVNNNTIVIKYTGEGRELFDFSVTTGDIHDIALDDPSKVLVIRYNETTAKVIIIYDIEY